MDASFSRHLWVVHLSACSVVLSEVVLQSHGYYQVRHWRSVASVARALFKGRNGPSFTRRRWLLSDKIGLALRLYKIVIASQVPFDGASRDKELVISLIGYIPTVDVSRGQVHRNLDSWHHVILIATVLLGPILSISLFVPTGCRYRTVSISTTAPVRIQAGFFKLEMIRFIRLVPIESVPILRQIQVVEEGVLFCVIMTHRRGSRHRLCPRLLLVRQFCRFLVV